MWIRSNLLMESMIFQYCAYNFWVLLIFLSIYWNFLNWSSIFQKSIPTNCNNLSTCTFFYKFLVHQTRYICTVSLSFSLFPVKISGLLWSKFPHNILSFIIFSTFGLVVHSKSNFKDKTVFKGINHTLNVCHHLLFHLGNKLFLHRHILTLHIVYFLGNLSYFLWIEVGKKIFLFWRFNKFNIDFKIKQRIS